MTHFKLKSMKLHEVLVYIHRQQKLQQFSLNSNAKQKLFNDAFNGQSVV